MASGLGFVLGSHLAVGLTAPFLLSNTQGVSVLWEDLPSVMALACLVALTAMLPPMLALMRMDPNRTLREE